MTRATKKPRVKKAKDPKKQRLGRRSRQKGKTWEREIVRDLRGTFPRAHRGHQDARGGAAPGEGCDIEGTPFYIEARHEKSYDWRRHLRESEAKRDERGELRMLALIAKEDRKPVGWKVGDPTTAIVVMRYDEWLELVTGSSRNENLR